MFCFIFVAGLLGAVGMFGCFIGWIVTFGVYPIAIGLAYTRFFPGQLAAPSMGYAQPPVGYMPPPGGYVTPPPTIAPPGAEPIVPEAPANPPPEN